MKKFLVRVFALIILVILMMTGVVSFHRYVIGSQYKYNYQAALLDKVQRLESIDGPKIILVGNSNLAFGIDSEIIQEKTGMPVVNLGLHGSLGNKLHENIAKNQIGEGDIVVVCHTSYAGDNDEIDDYALAWITYDWNDELLPIFADTNKLDMAKAYPTFFRKAFSLWLSGNGNMDIQSVYTRHAFNEYGDVAFKPDEAKIDDDKIFELSIGNDVPTLSEATIQRLNEFNKYVEKCGARMVVAAYPVGYGKYSRFGKDDYISFQNKLKNKLQCDVISDFTDYFYEYKYFYDTCYHLTNEGTRIRSMQLADDLCNWMGE